MALWTSDKYIAGIEKLTLSQSPTLNHGGSALQKQRSKYHRINMLPLSQHNIYQAGPRGAAKNLKQLEPVHNVDVVTAS